MTHMHVSKDHQFLNKNILYIDLDIQTPAFFLVFSFNAFI